MDLVITAFNDSLLVSFGIAKMSLYTIAYTFNKGRSDRNYVETMSDIAANLDIQYGEWEVCSLA